MSIPLLTWTFPNFASLFTSRVKDQAADGLIMRRAAPSQESLLPSHRLGENETEMERLPSGPDVESDQPRKDIAYHDAQPAEGEGSRARDGNEVEAVVYRVYKRRFIGLFQLVLLNVMVSWDVSTCLQARPE